MVERQALQSILGPLLQQLGLPDSYWTSVNRALLPLAAQIQRWQAEAGRPLLVGVQGAQGTGKSTLCALLARWLCCHYRLPTVSLSLDDVYLTRAQRRTLAATVHPLLATRGVPGSHDLPLANRVLDQLLQAGKHQRVALPGFDKSEDQRLPECAWRVHHGPVAVILLEGWCLGLRPQPPTALHTPVNRLEADEDADGIWRGYVNSRLAGDYQALFARLDKLVVLQAPSLLRVRAWRQLQEQKLAGAGGSRVMSSAELARFMMHYERLTRWALADLPSRADWQIRVADDHGLYGPGT